VSAPATIRVLVAVQDPITVLGLQAALNAAPDMSCAASAPERLADIRGLVAEVSPDVLLLDVALRRADPKLLPDLAATDPGTKVLVYVDHSPEECVLRHMLEVGGRAGLSPEALTRLDDCCLTSLRHAALGCVAKGTRPESVVGAVRAVAAGDVVAAPWLASLANAVQGHPSTARDASPISARELEVMTLLAKGLSNKEIAARLGLREQTVKNHVTRMMHKLGAENRTEVGLLAARHKLRLVEGEGADR